MSPTLWTQNQFRLLSCRFLVLMVLFLGWWLPVSALDPKKELIDYSHAAYQDDLPQNTVHSIVQTKDGYLWFGTYEGVARFDGVRFTIFDGSNTPQIRNNSMMSLAEGPDGSLWMATKGGGLVRYQNHAFTSFTTENGLPSNFLITVCVDKQGRVWVGTQENGVVVYDNGKFQLFNTQNGLSANAINTLFCDHQGAMWIGTTGGGICRYFNNQFVSFSRESGLASTYVKAICEDQSRRVWIGLEGGGITILDNGQSQTLTTADGLPSNVIRSLYCDREGSIWIGTEDRGVCRFQHGRFSSLGLQEGLTSNIVRSLCEDHEGNMWIGTNGGGLNVLREQKFTTYTTKHGLSASNVRVVTEDRTGGIWIGTEGGGINYLKDGKFTVYSTREGLPNDFIRCVLEDSRGVIWIGTNGGGLCKFENGKFTTYTTKDGLSYNRIYALCEDREGTLWVGTIGGGLSYYKNGTFGIVPNFPSKIVEAIFEDHLGNLWFGTDGSGLVRFKDGMYTRFESAVGILNQSVHSFYEDAAGTLWMCTNGGISCYQNGVFYNFTRDDGIFENQLFQILEDGHGSFWLSCNRGIFSVKREELEAFMAGKILKIKSTVYGISDGMKSNQCNGGSQPAGCRTRDGRLWFATIGGLTVIDPQHIRTNLLPPPVAIEALDVDGTPVDLSQAVELKPGSDRIEFSYAGLSFLSPGKVKFKVFLEGYDHDWVEVGARRNVRYTNLPPRRYQFLVQACNNDGVWSQTQATLNFTLKPHWYQTWWASILYFATVAGGLYGGHQYRLRRLHRQNALLEAKVVDRTAQLDQKNEELAQTVVEVKNAKTEVEQKNKQLDAKIQELLASQRQADRIFSALTEAMPGTVIDEKYRLDEKIGSGGFGAVFRATHLALNRQVAVKVFRPTPGNDSADAIERFRLEGISASRINHPHVVAILDSGITQDGVAYLVMELLNGHSLAQEMKEFKVLTLRRCLEITVPICEALAKAHQMGVIHRDIKPENIYLHQTPNGEVVKLVDFGIAKLVEDELISSRHKLTLTGGIIGTPAYMAPERLNNSKYDGKSDVYSLGIVVYEMLCGRTPFQNTANNLVEMVIFQLQRNPPKLHTVNPHIPLEIEAVVHQALEKDPNRRPTPTEFTEALAKAAANYPELLKEDTPFPDMETDLLMIADMPTQITHRSKLVAEMRVALKEPEADELPTRQVPPSEMIESGENSMDPR